MKTLVFITLALALVLPTNSISAQDSKMSLGIQLKPTLTWISGIAIAYNMRPSYSAGLISEYEINSQFGIKSGISFKRKGIKSSISFIDTVGIVSGPFDVYYNSDYFIVPIVASFSTKGNGKVKAYFDGGSYIGYSLSQRITQETYNHNSEITTNYTDYIKRIDFGVSLGSGLYIPLGKSFVFDIGLNANLGLLNARKDDKNSDHPLKPNSVGLLMGIKYRL